MLEERFTAEAVRFVLCDKGCGVRLEGLQLMLEIQGRWGHKGQKQVLRSHYWGWQNNLVTFEIKNNSKKKKNQCSYTALDGFNEEQVWRSPGAKIRGKTHPLITYKHVNTHVEWGEGGGVEQQQQQQQHGTIKTSAMTQAAAEKQSRRISGS